MKFHDNAVSSLCLKKRVLYIFSVGTCEVGSADNILCVLRFLVRAAFA